MALSVETRFTASNSPHLRIAHVVVTFDDSYATGGETFDPLAYGGLNPAVVVVSVRPGTSTTYVVQHNAATGKMMAFRTKDPGNAGGADIVLQEVANAVDLSTLVVDVLIFSR